MFMKIPLEERFFEVYYVWLTFLHIKFVATKWHWNDTEPKWQYFCEMFLLVVITLHLIVHYMFKHTLVQYSYKNPNRYIGNQKLTWSTLVEGYEQPYRPHCSATQSIKVNIFFFQLWVDYFLSWFTTGPVRLFISCFVISP